MEEAESMRVLSLRRRYSVRYSKTYCARCFSGLYRVQILELESSVGDFFSSRPSGDGAPSRDKMIRRTVAQECMVCA